MVSRANLVVFAFFKQPPFLSLKGLVPLLMVSSLDSIALLFALPHGLKCIIIDDILDYGRVWSFKAGDRPERQEVLPSQADRIQNNLVQNWYSHKDYRLTNLAWSSQSMLSLRLQELKKMMYPLSTVLSPASAVAQCESSRPSRKKISQTPTIAYRNL